MYKSIILLWRALKFIITVILKAFIFQTEMNRNIKKKLKTIKKHAVCEREERERRMNEI